MKLQSIHVPQNSHFIEHDCEIGIHLFIAIVLHIDAYIYNVAHFGIVIADNRHIGDFERIFRKHLDVEFAVGFGQAQAILVSVNLKPIVIALCGFGSEIEHRFTIFKVIGIENEHNL